MSAAPFDPTPAAAGQRRLAIAAVVALFAAGFVASFGADPVAAAPKPPATGPKAESTPAAPATIRFAPRAHPLSKYEVNARYEMHFKDVTYEVPEAYRDSFAFWTGRMKGKSKFEVYQFNIQTLDAAENGSVPFTRRLPHFNLEVAEEGRTRVPFDPLEQKLRTWIWDGTLDPLGNITEIHKTAGRDDEEFKNLALPFVESAFPVIKSAIDVSPGGGFDEERIVPLPEPPPKINGLENVRLKVTRTYRLKEVTGDLAVFDVTVTYAMDPATLITVPDTTCAISGGGSGAMTFDVRRGLFVSTHLPTIMTLDISAPLRTLPDRPETANPGNGKTHVVMNMTLDSSQIVSRPWGSDPD